MSDVSDPARWADLHESLGLLPGCPLWGPHLSAVPEPSRVAFAGCWHGRHHLVGAAMLAAKEAGADLVVHTGDFLYTGPAASKTLMVAQEWCARLDMRVIAVRGNHDDPSIYTKASTSTRRRNRNQAVVADPFARLSERVLHAPNGTRWTWHGTEFVALGGAFSVDRAARVEGVSYWRGEVATPREVNRVKSGGKANVMITHDTPAEAHLDLPSQRPDWWDITNAEKHRDLLRSAVDAVEPEWVIGGHMHLRATTGLWTPTGQQVRVEVLDKIENGTSTNLFVADLSDGELLPVEE